MATTTPNYGWAVPTSTDLVKDGATAIETLGDSIDASMFTALGTKKAGMVLLNTTSFSAVSAVNLTANTFSSSYDYYRLYVVLTGSTTSQAISGRLRAAGTDATGSNYNYEDTSFSSTSVGAARAINQTSWRIGNAESTNKNYIMLDLIDPFLAEPTAFFTNNTENGYSTTSVSFKLTAGGHTLSTSYDAFSFYPASGTISGKVSVFGVNK